MTGSPDPGSSGLRDAANGRDGPTDRTEVSGTALPPGAGAGGDPEDIPCGHVQEGIEPYPAGPWLIRCPPADGADISVPEDAEYGDAADDLLLCASAGRDPDAKGPAA